MPNWNQIQERDPKKMLENLQNVVGGQVPPQTPMEGRREAVGGGFTSAPSYDPDAETNAQIAAQQAATVQQAAQDPGMAAKLAAFNEAIRQRNLAAQQEQLNRMKILQGQ